ncbi:MAG: MerR family transcriptional regulator [Microthrixaceae bacterium]
MTEATASSHLSIGEVLSLVQEDFPDVTISKIRFLESQGLIAPERTGSGYRKFYDADIDRLRWILRQQRDHFLPLKVIKKMLDEGIDLHGGTEAQPTLWSSTESLPASAGSAAASQGELHADAGDEGAGIAATVPSTAGSAGSASGEVDDEDDEARRSYRSPSHPAVASASPRRRGTTTEPRPEPGRSAAGSGDSAGPAQPVGASSGTASYGTSSGPSTDTPSGRSTDDADTGSSSAPAPSSAGPPTVSDGPAVAQEPSPSDRGPSERGASGADAADASASGPPDHAEDPPVARPAHSTPADVVAALQEDPRAARRGKGRPREVEPIQEEEPATQAAPAVVPSSVPAFEPSPPLASLLSAEELCELCGITPELLAGLEQFGLVVPASLGGRSAYDADAVDVARIAARYVDLGVEPRHLRMYKVSAEREAGFVEQLVVPLIKQRNPAARQQAAERADDLITMGAHLHAALLRRQLGRLLGP